jgi:shikimate dehydrogenase
MSDPISPPMGRIGGATRLAGVIGWPVAHSRSPAIHNAAYAHLGLDMVYVPLAVEPTRLAVALRGLVALGFVGVNVTVPHKPQAAELVDELDEVAREVGAVNTIRVAVDGRLVATNTDVAGYADGLDEIGTPVGPAVVLGAGGAARAVIVALRRRGHEVQVVARDPARAQTLAETRAAAVHPWSAAGLEHALAGARLLVDATSLALDPTAEAAVVAGLPLGRLAEGALVSSLVYHREPALLAAARARGLAVQDGAAMLVHQAARAFTFMTGQVAPLAVMRAAFVSAGAGPLAVGTPKK